MLRLRDACFAVLMTTACSPVFDPSNVPDAAIDATDMRPPMIESSRPANMETKVSILQPISVFFDEPLDPDSVSAMTVRLGYDRSQPPLMFPNFQIAKEHGPIPAGLTPVRGAVSYDPASRKISFVPTAPLPYGYRFTLVMDVKDTAGLPFTGKVSFHTYVNGNTRQTNFNVSTGAVVSWVGQPTDMGGRPAKYISGSAFGTDGIWFTPDDPRNQRSDYAFGPEGRILEERYFDSGPDGRYDTPDDPTVICTKYLYDAQGTLAERVYANAAGPDSMWCTPDDVPTYNSVYSYMDGKLNGWVINSAPGADMAWHTADDLCVVYFDYSYDARGNKTRELYRSCGGDGLPRTADDTYNFYYDYEYDANGDLAKLSYRTGAGTDGMWLTPDDSFGHVERYVRNADGLVTDVIRTTAPGADMVWGTPDDSSGTRTSNTYNATKLVEGFTTYSAFGADMMWGTPDDVINRYDTLTYDANGNRLDQKTYVAGPDGMWKTADDRVSADYDFETTK